MKPDRDPPPVVSDVRTRHVLAFAPVETIADPDRRDALDSANGVDLVKRRVQRALAVAGTIVILLVVARCLLGCAPGEFGAGAKVANTIALGAACGMAAANETPCTPQVVLDALARDAASQRAKIEAVAPAAAAVDPALTAALLEQMKANTESNKALTAALLSLAVRAAPAPSTEPTKAADPVPPAPPPAASPQ